MRDVGPHPLWKRFESGAQTAQEPAGGYGVRHVPPARGGDGRGAGHLAPGGRPPLGQRLPHPQGPVLALAGVVRFCGTAADRLVSSEPLRPDQQQRHPIHMSTAPFWQAVEAIATGDEPGLRALLQAHPGLIHERAPFAHQATLLHYVAANGVEVQRAPGNAPAIARILLEAGAEADAVAPVYGASDTTLCLTVTSVHPYLAGVQASLVDVLADHGARIGQ